MAKYDIDKIIELHDRSALRGQAERYSYERDWFRNVLYLLGVQWIVYSPASRKWQPRKIAKWVPRPVTNKFASVAMSMIQVLTQRDPVVRARAATTNPDDIAAAEIADRNFDVILDEAGAAEARDIAASWMTLTGSAIFHPSYDNDPIHGSTFLQHLFCPSCQKTFPPDMEASVGTNQADQKQGIPLNQGPIQGSTNGNVGGMPGTGNTGQPQNSQISPATACPFCGNPQVIPTPDGSGEELPSGKLKLDTYAPFECFFDLEGRKWSENKRILTRRRFDVDEIRRKFNRPDLEPDNNSNVGGAIGLNLLRAIAYASGNAVYGTGIASGRSLGDDQSITIDALWERPCSDYPEGLVAIFDSANNLLNEATVKEGIPYRDKKGNPIWPWHLATFDQVPGRMFGKTPLDDVAPKQEQRNKLEAMIQLIITRAANPVWLIAKNLGITQITGEPGQILEGNWAMDPRLKPDRVPGENIPTSLIAWLEKIDKDIEDVAGIFEVLKGSAPPGVTAGTALRLLLERATTRFAPVAQRFEKVWQAVCQDLLILAQQNWVDERISKVQGPGNSWEIRAFSNADIQGSIDIIVEAGSSLPKSMVGEQALIQDLTAMGVINPQNPETQYKILQRFGSTDLLGDVDLNMRYAQRENWEFDQNGVLPVMDLILDVHAVHIMVHKEMALKSDFMEWPDEKKQAWTNHILDHMLAAAPPMNAMDPAGPPVRGDEGKKMQEKGQSQESGHDSMEAEPAGGIM